MNGNLESLKDPKTTHRTDRHRRQAPKRRDLGPNTSLDKNMATEQYMEQNPILNEYAKQIALARLAVYNQEKGGGTSTGWGETFEYPPNPYPDLFDENNPDDMTAAAELLAMKDDAQYQKAVQEFAKWYATKDQPQLRLKEMTEDEAKANKIPWYESTDAYLRALAATGAIPSEDAVRSMAQMHFYNTLMDDLRSGSPKYEQALRTLIDNDREHFYPSDTTEVIRRDDPTWGEDREFIHGRGHDVKNFLMNGFLPFTNRIADDPELWHRASKFQVGSRLAGDVAMDLLLYGMAPELAATRLALMAGGRAAAGGALGLGTRALARAGAGAGVGGAGWLLKNYVADPAYHAATGVGTQQGPADVRDLGLEMLLGGAGNTLSTGFLRGAMPAERAFKIPEAMAPGKPSAVKGSDITAAFKAMDDPKVVSPTSDRARQLFENTEFEKYRKTYNNPKKGIEEVVKVESHPPMVIDLTPKEGGPMIVGAAAKGFPKGERTGVLKTMTQTPDHRYFGFVPMGIEDKGIYTKMMPTGSGVLESGPTRRMMMADKTRRTLLKELHGARPADGGEVKHLREVTEMVPETREVRLYEKPEADEFRVPYLEQHPEHFGKYSKEEKKAMGALMKAGQERRSVAASQFSGEPEFLTGPDFAAELSAARGNPLADNASNLKNTARQAQLYHNSTAGVRDKSGNWTTSQKQQKRHDKAKEIATRRKDMNIVGRDYLNGTKDYQLFPNGVSGARKTAGWLLQKGGAPFVSNNANTASDLIPYAIDLLGPRAEQIEYYDED